VAFYPGSQYDRQQRIAQTSQLEDHVHGGRILWYLANRQFGVPISDFSVGNWTTQSGGTTNLFATLDETNRDDSDYIRSELTPVSSPVTLQLTSLSTPLAGVQYLRYTYGKDNSSQINLTVELLEGASVTQTWTHTDVPLGFFLATQQITNAISDYTNLRVRFTASQV